MGSETKKVTLTEQQKAVISNRGGDLLVSAAAGSGKTKVLVDRIMSYICGTYGMTKDMYNITDFVVITYTHAAAQELREKIVAELSKRLAADPSNDHLRSQIHLMYNARICTVHSFCSDLIHANAALAGLPTNIRVCEEQESRVLKAAAMEDMLEGTYKHLEKKPNIKAFIETLAYGRDDSAVPAILYSIYDTVQSHPWPDKWIEECVANMDVSKYKDASETPWGQYIMADLSEQIHAQLSLIEEALDICDHNTALSEAFTAALQEDRKVMGELLSCRTWDRLYMKAEHVKWGRQKAIKKKEEYSEEERERIRALRSRYKHQIESRLKNVYGLSKEVLEDLKMTKAPIVGMFEMMSAFTDFYKAKKEMHGVLDFSDLEHITINLLLDEATGKRTMLAETLRAQYKEILIDEYQDTNSVQETIFRALSKKNLCMVGDIKQSIYMFRLADPQIFLKHYKSYQSYLTAAGNEPRKILLNKNFRSRAEILNAVNDVMETCMSPEVGGVEYDENERLVPGRTDFTPLRTPAVELDVIDMETVEGSREDTEESLAKIDVEARYVAQRIKAMIENEQIMDDDTGLLRPVKASDIAVLMRSVRNSAAHYIRGLAEYGIECKASREGSIMETSEVATLYSFLQIVDNPTQDIPLAAVMASPLVGFTAEDLAAVRISRKDARSFYEALQEYVVTSGVKNNKATEFLNLLQDLRKKAPVERLSQLYDRILQATDAEDVFGSMQNGDLRMANIQRFREMITEFENRAAGGLLSFIFYIEGMKEQGAELPQARIATNEDAVTIMSVHSSKGLEFPIVFLSDLSRKFNSSDLKASALIHKDLGAGVQVFDKELRYRYPTIARNAISMAMADEGKSEELRILYVAMTRAKQRIVMTYCDRLSRTLTKLGTTIRYPLPITVAKAALNPGEWILVTCMLRPEGDLLRLIGNISDATAHNTETPPWTINYISAEDVGGKRRTMEELETEETFIKSAISDEEPWETLDDDQLEHDLSFTYAFENATTTPTKAVASSLFGAVNVRIKRPEFAKAEGYTSAERGTATHEFLQYCNLKLCVEKGIDGINAEINRMVSQRYITEHQSHAILKAALVTFFKTPIARELAMSPVRTVKREFPFSLLIPANKVFGTASAKDKVLIQGIVDIHRLTKSGIELYDFKTDYAENEEDELTIASGYKGQMDMYRNALEEIYHQPVLCSNIIFLRSGHMVSVK